MKLSQIEKLAETDRFDEALAECEALLRDGTIDTRDVLRTRAHVFALSGRHVNASADYEEIIKLGAASIRDYYQAGDQALKASDLELAHRRFQDVLSIGKQQGETWFESAVLFYLAYVEMNRNNHQCALGYAAQAATIERDCAMPLPERGMVGIEELKAEIQQRCR